MNWLKNVLSYLVTALITTRILTTHFKCADIKHTKD